MRKLILLFVIVALLFTMNTGLSVAEEIKTNLWKFDMNTSDFTFLYQ